MDNGTKISKEQIDNIKNELKDIKNNSGDLDSFLKKHLSTDESEKVKALLSDPQKLKAILSSPFGKGFMEKYGSKE